MIESHCIGWLTIVKWKSSRIVIEEVNKTIDNNVAWSCGQTVEVTFYNNVFTGLDIGFATRATDRGVGKEFLLVLINRSMFCGHTGKLHI